jgi:D-alanine-D-alanine ligase
MNSNSKPLIGVAYNLYVPIALHRNEKLSEETVEEMAQQAYEAVLSLDYPAVLIPLKESFMGFLRRIQEVKPQVIINLCESFCGRPKLEANVAAAYELLEIPFTGNPARTLTLCQDKFQTKSILASHGLPTAKCRLVAAADQAVGLRFPLIVKPNAEDASLGVYPDSVVRDGKALRERILKILETYEEPALVEEFIEGREFNVAVMDGEKPEALPVSEIDFSAMPEGLPRIVSYEAKWFEDHDLYLKTPPVCPARVADTVRARLQECAVKAFEAMGCQDYARVDFRMNKDGDIFILEVNPNPDIRLNAGYVRALAAREMDYPSFWGRMIENALRRNESHGSAYEKVR